MESSKTLDLLSSSNIITSENQLPASVDLNALVEFLDSSKFKYNKTFKSSYKNIETKTYIQTINNSNKDYWCLRKTVLSGVNINTYRSEFVKKLNGYNFENGMYKLSESDAPNKCLIESEYIHSIISSTCSSVVANAEGCGYFVKIRNIYKLSPSVLLNHRLFNQWVYISAPFKDISNNCEITLVLTLRGQNSQEEKSKLVPAYYISIECLKYNLSTKELIWKMATCSDAGGNLPIRLQKMGIDKAIAHDVEAFLRYIKY